MNSATIAFTLQPSALGHPVSVRLRRTGERWVAQLEGSSTGVGIGGSPRSALQAALEPLGSRVAAMLLADLGLLEPSVRVIELERAAGQ